MTNETQSESFTPCPECGGQRVNVLCGGYMTLQLNWYSVIGFQALACTVCGYTALYAREPQKLQRFLEEKGGNR